MSLLSKLPLLFERAYSSGFNIVITVVVARFFGVEAVGNLAVVFIFSAVGQYLTSRGTDQNIQVIYASQAGDERLAIAITETSRRLVFLLYAVVCIGLLCITFANIVHSSTVNAVLYALAGLVVGAVMGCSMPNEIRLVVAQKFKLLAGLKYVCGGSALLIGMLLLFGAGLGYQSIVITIILEKILYLSAMIVDIKRSEKDPKSFINSKKVPKVNFHILMTAAAVFGYNRLDQIYIYGALSSQDLGIYFSSVRLFDIANLIVMAIITSKLHIMADLRRAPEEITLIERKLLAFSFGLVVFVAIGAPMALGLIFEISVENTSYLSVLALGTLFGLIGAIKAPWVARNNRYHSNSNFTIAGAFFAVCVLTIFAPKSLVLVALTMAASQFIVNVLCPLLIKEERDYLISLVSWCKK